MTVLPRLRDDLIVEAVNTDDGSFYDISNAQMSRTHRLASPAYLALAMLDGS